jgi:hypothetical protein
MNNNSIENAIKFLNVVKGKERYIWYKLLLDIGKTNPQKLFPFSFQIGEALKSDKPDILYFAIYLTAYISKKENFFQSVFDDYISLLSHESVVVAPHTARLMGLIVNNNPQIELKITPILLDIENRARCKNKELVKGYTIRTFNDYFKISNSKEDIVVFVKNQLQSKSSVTKKTAKEFLKKYNF